MENFKEVKLEIFVPQDHAMKLAEEHTHDHMPDIHHRHGHEE
jgi:hypothetical protein